ncbi:DUF373 family protein [Methanotorris formicicus]|uniref:DUF373 family protein n=1 Tax=Methanotorris formicicus Mc-S-70 TaxID=647171 RepID=H1KYJ8_9EURY|nr:DUF373 family protein [Methanotorris formicicus]EHP87038.1 protein of unknown function DUF373 [Methanotorris formicicus Mc-S-70]
MEVKKLPEIKRYLVLIVDMDDDVGRKANIATPILGREDNIKAAIKLGLSDPGDSDINAILGGVKLYDELKNKGKNVEIATISGDKDVESEKCALRIKEQLDFLMYLYEPNFIYLVSDGKEDEMVLKYLDSRDVFVWKKRIVIKQNESLESIYYLIHEFIKKTMSDYIPLIFTSAGFAMILYAIFSELGWRIIVGLIGLYILSEGVGVRKLFIEKIKKGGEGIELGKISPMGTVIALLILVVGALYAYGVSKSDNPVIFAGNFLYHISNPLTLSLFVFMLGHFIDKIIHSKEPILNILKKYFFYTICLFMARELLITSSEFLRGSESFTMLMIHAVVYTSIIIILSTILFTKSSTQVDTM